ncbi:hypothetical protein BGX34_001830 [Mortierella sp. NVP85]|nr:hypothetical protein BGX34_001830 [Mortierella sp. NVP85]
MLHSIPSSVTLTVLTLALNLLFLPSVAAQNFRPRPNSETCFAYTEGQGLYVLGGHTKENFMLDLSVSWNTSDPVFKEISGGPIAEGGACAMINNGEDLFVLTKGTGYVYNVKTSSWRVFQNPNFGTSGDGQVATTDPKTGIIYLPTYGLNFAGEKVLVMVDLKTNTVSETPGTLLTEYYRLVIWSAYLESIIIQDQNRTPFMFTPSMVSSPGNGWSRLYLTKVTPPGTYFANFWSCGAAAYNGTKLFHIGLSNNVFSVYIMDVFILWGGYASGKSGVSSDQNMTYVFNMKTEKWISRYTAPPLPTMTTHIPQPSQTSIQHTPYATATSESGNASSSDMKLVTIIVIVTGILMAIILGIILRYHRRTSQFNSDCQRTSPDGSSTDSLNTRDGLKTSVKELSLASSRRRDPSDSGSDSTDRSGRLKWHMSGSLGRMHQGSLGTRPLSEHPHAIVEDPTTRRNVQEGALEAQILSQHPHAIVGVKSVPKRSDKVIWEPTRSYGDKEELEEQ